MRSLVGLALHWLGEWASLDVLCLGCFLVHENYLKQVACSIDTTTFDAATGFGSRVVYESSVNRSPSSTAPGSRARRPITTLNL